MRFSRDEPRRGATPESLSALDTTGDRTLTALGPPGAMSQPHVEELPSGRVLIVPLNGAHEVISWAIVNGGRRRARSVVWRELRLAELDPHGDGGALMRETLAQLGMPDAVGLLTARDVRTYEDERVERSGTWARCIATVGLGNALAAGDPPAAAPVGTINLVCQVSVGLSEEALIEA